MSNLTNLTQVVGIANVSRNVTLTTDPFTVLTDLAELATRVVDALDAAPVARNPQVALTIAFATPLLLDRKSVV